MTARRNSLKALGHLGATLGTLLFLACSSSEDARPSNEVEDAGRSLDASGAADGNEDSAAPDADAALPIPNYDFAVACAGDPCVTQIAARGGSHACVVLQSGTVRCWGSNESGQLGTGVNDGAPMAPFDATPRDVVGISNAAGLAATGQGLSGTTCVVSRTGDVSCFGSDASGQLGRAAGTSNEPHPEPAVIAGLQATSVTLANTFALATGTDGSLWSWGTNEAFQLARMPAVPSPGPSTAPGRADRISTPVRSHAGTSRNGFVVTGSGDVLSWGGSASGELGRSSSLAADPLPAAVALSDTSSVVSGASHVCASSRAGRVHCWGRNDHGQLGTGIQGAELLPAPVLLPDGVLAVAVAAGGDNTCIIAASGELYCWGANGGGQIGTPVGQDEPRPHRINGLKEQVVSVAVMDDSICALLRGGSVYCWGDNLVGQLGRGTRDAEIHVDAAPIVLE